MNGGTIIRSVEPVRADARPRLLAGLRPDGRASGLDAHLDQWGPVDWRRTRLSLIGEVDASGLAGHGGAWFPVGTKWRAIARQRGRRPIVVANGAEGEPASGKDALLLTRAPHLVLDGLAAASVALRAVGAVVYVPEHLTGPVEAAIAMRRRRHLDPVTMMVACAPDTYLAGQEAAVVRSLNGGPALPYFVGLRSVRQHGVDGRPTLVQNVETFAHVALVARFGARWFRGMGTAELPGTMLLSVSGRWDRPAVVEAPLGTGLADVLDLASSDVGRYRGALLGGYGGGWVSAGGAARPRAWTERQVRQAGASLGAGVVALLPTTTCPLAEMARVVRYLAGQGAGQCGPCREGLPALADELDRPARSGPAHRGPASARSSTCALWSRVVAPAGTLMASLGSHLAVRAGLRRRDRRPPPPRAMRPDRGRRLAPRPHSVRRGPASRLMKTRYVELVVDPVACDGHGCLRRAASPSTSSRTGGAIRLSARGSIPPA